MATQEYLGRKSRVAMRYKAGFGSTADLDAADDANIILLVDPAGLKKWRNCNFPRHRRNRVGADLQAGFHDGFFDSG